MAATSQHASRPETATAPAAAAIPGGTLRRGVRLARLWFASEERSAAWALALVSLALKLVQVGIQLRINLWHRDAFDALQRQDGAAL